MYCNVAILRLPRPIMKNGYIMYTNVASKLVVMYFLDLTKKDKMEALQYTYTCVQQVQYNKSTKKELLLTPC